MTDPKAPQLDDAGFDALIDRHGDRQGELARRVRALVIEVDPSVVEVVWPHQGTAGWGVGPKKMTEHYAWLQLATNHVNLGFNQGAHLPDPAGLLEGTGAHLRHVKVRTATDLERPDIRDLLRAARSERLAALGRS